MDDINCTIHQLKTEVVKWADSVSKLKNRSPMTACAKMTEEIGELMLAIHSEKLGDPGEECADVMIILLDIIHMLDIDIAKEVRNKVKTLNTREWEVINGLLRHKEEE